MKISILICVLLASCSLTGLYGQKSKGKITITGYVVDRSATPVADAVIMINGKKTGKFTDSKGFYKIKVRQENNKIGVFTSTCGIIEEVINGRENIDFAFKCLIPYQKTDPDNEPIEVGYGRVKKKDLTVMVGKIDGTKSIYDDYNTIYDLIRGRFPGVTVNGTSIIVEGIHTLNSGTDPLFIVDGIQVTNLDNIRPQMVRSIELLKGSSAAVYGSRGSNGVFLISLLNGSEK